MTREGQSVPFLQESVRCEAPQTTQLSSLPGTSPSALPSPLSQHALSNACYWPWLNTKPILVRLWRKDFRIGSLGKLQIKSAWQLPHCHFPYSKLQYACAPSPNTYPVKTVSSELGEVARGYGAPLELSGHPLGSRCRTETQSMARLCPLFPLPPLNTEDVKNKLIIGENKLHRDALFMGLLCHEGNWSGK